MAARPISSTTIAFGLVSLPVKLFSTTESSRRISFNLMSPEGNRVRQKYVDSETGDEVERSEMKKGYEFAKGQYVLFEPDELKQIEAPKGDSIEITEFVPREAVNPIYYDRTYYLGPDKGGARAYRLLSRALRDEDMVAIGKYATRGKQYLVMIRPESEDGLAMEQLHYAEEIRAFDEVPVDEADVKDAELKLAKQLIEQAASKTFDPTAYTDEVREKILELIEAKVEGEEITVAAAPEDAEPKIIDLMEALKASLEDEERKPAAKAGKKKVAAKKKKGGKKAASG